MRRTGPFSRAGAGSAPRRACIAVRNGSAADVIYDLNMTRLPVIGTELYRAQLSNNSLDLCTVQNGHVPAQRVQSAASVRAA